MKNSHSKENLLSYKNLQLLNAYRTSQGLYTGHALYSSHIKVTRNSL